MPTPYIGEIRLFAFVRVPKGWALCDGSLLSIGDNESLFSVIGTAYGGDGVKTFALPDLRGRVPLGMGTGPGLSPRIIGEQLGQEQVTLLGTQLPAHTHQLNTSAGDADVSDATDTFLATAAVPSYASEGGLVGMSPNAIKLSNGGSQPHENMPPFLCMNYYIALQGIYPSRP